MNNIPPDALREITTQGMEYANDKVGKITDLKERTDFTRWAGRNKGFIDGAKSQYNRSEGFIPEDVFIAIAYGMFIIIALYAAFYH